MYLDRLVVRRDKQKSQPTNDPTQKIMRCTGKVFNGLHELYADFNLSKRAPTARIYNTKQNIGLTHSSAFTYNILGSGPVNPESVKADIWHGYWDFILSIIYKIYNRYERM